MNPTSRIFAGDLHGVLWLRVEGKGSFQVSQQLDQFASAKMQRGTTHVVVDLEHCPTMDSTFMGTLTCIAQRVRDLSSGCFQVVNVSTRNHQLLEGLGLTYVFEVDVDGATWKAERAMISETFGQEICCSSERIGRREQCETMINAHEALSQAKDENVPKFHDVLDCLNREMATLA